MEIKLRLPSKEAHDKVAHELRESYRETHQQENYFFDGPNKELSAQRSVLRCRFYNHDQRALVTLKASSTPRPQNSLPLLCVANACNRPQWPLAQIAVGSIKMHARGISSNYVHAEAAGLLPSSHFQGGQIITDGVGRGSEVEDDVDPKAAREFLDNPSKLLALDLPFIQELKQCAAVPLSCNLGHTS